MPRFTHDCSNCIYLGSSSWADTNKAYEGDHYFCPNKIDKGTVIVRYGNSGEEYISSCVRELATMGRHLTGTAILAVQQGFLDVNDIRLMHIHKV